MSWSGAALQHSHKIDVDLPGKRPQFRGGFGETPAVALQPLQVRAGFDIAVGHQPGHGQHDGVTRMDQIAVAHRQVLFEVLIDREKFPVEHVGTGSAQSLRRSNALVRTI